ncbi:8287_t:CDS:2, partial [Gigaspora rosea]
IIWFGLILLSKSYDLTEILDIIICGGGHDGYKDGKTFSQKLVKYEEWDPERNGKPSLNIIHLHFYPRWVNDIELILNGIEPKHEFKYIYTMEKEQREKFLLDKILINNTYLV